MVSENSNFDHNAKSAPGIKLNRESNLAFDWETFANGLTETAANFLIKGWADGGTSALVSIGKVFTSISIDEPTEFRTWRLIALAFAATVDSVKAESSLDISQLRNSMKRSLDGAKVMIDRGDISIEHSFLDKPSSSILYQKLRDSVVNDRNELGFSVKSNDVLLQYKMDVAFNRAVFEICSKDPSYFAGIREYFNSIGIKSVEADINWRNYRESLRFSFEVSPTFGQEQTGISLSEIYVPLRGYWVDYEKERASTIHFSDSAPNTANILKLDDMLDEWIDDNQDDDWLRLIGGGPGSGKSTSLKSFAHRLSSNDAVRPLFIPLQHIGMATDLRSAINQYFVQRAGCSFTHEPLSRRSLENGPRLVLILDGLDELVAPNENAKEAITIFAHKLNNLVSELRGESGFRVKAVLSGRMAAFQTAKQFLTLPEQGSIEVYGYAPSPDNDRSAQSELWLIDQRPEWWRKYARATGSDETIPEAFNSEELDGITNEPLLSYLLVLAGFATHNWKRAAENTNRIYSALMNDIYRRGWGDTSSKIRSMTLSDFNKLMQTIGLGAWLGGDTRVATEKLFLDTVKITRAEKAWATFNADRGPDVTNLAMNFYLKASEGAHRGFEFTHKSFGEYLAAVALLEAAIEIRSLPGLRMSFALDEWFNATKTGSLTPEVLNFLRQEVRLRLQDGSLEQVGLFLEVKESFCSIADAIADFGYPNPAGATWRKSEEQQRNFELSTWGVINAIVLAMASIGKTEHVPIKVKSLSLFGLTALLNRHHSIMSGNADISSCLSGISQETILVLQTSGNVLDLSYCSCEYIIFESGVFHNIILKDATTKQINFSNCRIMQINIDGISVKNISMLDSQVPLRQLSGITGISSSVDASTYLRSFKTLEGLGIDRDINVISVPSSSGYIASAREALENMTKMGWAQSQMPLAIE